MGGDRPRGSRLFSARFVSFLTAQFLGAANDNAFKTSLALFVLATIAGEAAQLRFNSLATLLFPLPFLLFSPLAGFLADRFRKTRVVPVTKAPEILAMALAVAAYGSRSLPMLMAVLFIMATQSAFFSPAKYGLLPEAFAHEKLSMANGILNMTTNMAILVGSVAGVIMFDRFRENPERIGWICLTIAVAGTLTSFFVPRTPAGNRESKFEWNPIGASIDNWRLIRNAPELIHTIVGIAYFSFLGAAFLAIIPVYGKNVLGLSETGAGLMLMILSVGVAAGSIIAGKLSQGRVEIGLVPLGSIGLTVFSIALALPGGESWPLPSGIPLGKAIALVLLGVSSGLYIVPLNALLQQRSPEGMKGRLIAFSNFVSFAAVVAAGVVAIVLSTFIGANTRHIVLVLSSLTLLATIYILTLLPNFLVRLVLYLITNAFYRLEVHGAENIPSRGALFVANHVSWVDALLVGTASDRMVRFLMFRPYYEAGPLHWLFKKMRVIPIARGDSLEQKTQSLSMAREEIEKGHVVCIFAEGALTRIGNLLRFRRGFEQIAAGMNAPIIPVCLDGVWGSVFSWERGRLLFKRPRSFRSRVRVLFGEPMPSSTGRHEVRQAVQELSVVAFDLRKPSQLPLEMEFLRRARRRWRRLFVADSAGRRLRFGQALVRSLALRRHLTEAGDSSEERFGILLPAGVDGALANLGLLAAGKTLINLDAGEGWDRVRRECEQARIGTVVTSARYFESIGRDGGIDGVHIIHVEEAEARISRTALAGYWIVCRLLPFFVARRVLFRGISADADRTAAIVFSASPHLGGLVRGAVLTHHNILSNMESLKQVFRLSRDDRILGLLPLSTAFGLTGTILLPAAAGFGVVYHDDPEDAGSIEALARAHRITVLPVSTDQLGRITDEIDPRALEGLRHAVVAGGRLVDEIGRRFEEKFGVEPLEGFGCAECAPLISLNVPTVVRDPHGQTGHRAGTSGRPLPGMAIRIVDTDGAELEPGNEGLLLVRGPNVMRGYLDDPELTSRVLRDGWYHTGYRAREDADGFLTILDLR